jgi:AcrR family transcriptional regulator
MPPKSKVSKEDVLNAAFEITRSQGFEACNAKNIGAYLGVSVTPIFRVFENMADLKAALYKKANAFYISFLKNYPFEKSQFLTYGLAYIDFARTEKRLFRLLMLSGAFRVEKIAEVVSAEFNFVKQSAEEAKMLSGSAAQGVFENVWIFTHGIATLVATDNLNISTEEASALLQQAFQAFIR